MNTELTNSRIITHPSLVEPSTNQTITIIDAREDQVKSVGMFLATSTDNYDVYLYRYDLEDLDWLNEITQRSSVVLKAEASTVELSATEFGPTKDFKDPLDYLIDLEKKYLTSTSEK